MLPRDLGRRIADLHIPFGHDAYEGYDMATRKRMLATFEGFGGDYQAFKRNHLKHLRRKAIER